MFVHERDYWIIKIGILLFSFLSFLCELIGLWRASNLLLSMLDGTVGGAEEEQGDPIVNPLLRPHHKDGCGAPSQCHPPPEPTQGGHERPLRCQPPPGSKQTPAKFPLSDLSSLLRKGQRSRPSASLRKTGFSLHRVSTFSSSFLRTCVRSYGDASYIFIIINFSNPGTTTNWQHFVQPP